jgi:hypothetical protein
MFAADIKRQRISRMRGFRNWRWHVDEVFVKIAAKWGVGLTTEPKTQTPRIDDENEQCCDFDK